MNHKSEMSDEQFRTIILEEIKRKTVLDWAVPLLLTALIGLVGFFGAQWIHRVDQDTQENKINIKIINDRQIANITNIESLQKGQNDIQIEFSKLSARLDQQNLDIRDTNTRLVKIETKLDYLTDYIRARRIDEETERQSPEK